MKSNGIMKVLAVLCAVIMLAAAGTKLLPLAHAEQYHVGDGEISAVVRELQINWTSGKVTFAYHNSGTILLSEKTAGVISEDMRMRWCLDGDTLRVEYDQPGFHLFSLMPHQKELTVTLPNDLTLEKVSVSSTSAEQIIPALNADSLKLKSTSGDIRAAVNARKITGKLTSGDLELQVMNEAEEIQLESTSGNITLESAGARDKTAIETTSGDIRAAVKQTEKCKVASTSGDIHAVIGDAKKTEIKSTNGKVTLEIASMEELEIRTTSGGVTAYLPAAPGFTVRVETASGHIEQRLPLTKQGKDYIAGDGSGKVKIHTTSGNITISPREN